MKHPAAPAKKRQPRTGWVYGETFRDEATKGMALHFNQPVADSDLIRLGYVAVRITELARPRGGKRKGGG